MNVIFLDIDGVLNSDQTSNPRKLPYIVDRHERGIQHGFGSVPGSGPWWSGSGELGSSELDRSMGPRPSQLSTPFQATATQSWPPVSPRGCPQEGSGRKPKRTGGHF